MACKLNMVCLFCYGAVYANDPLLFVFLFFVNFPLVADTQVMSVCLSVYSPGGATVTFTKEG